MSSWITSLAVKAGFKAAEKVLDYGASSIGAKVAFNQFNQVKVGIESSAELVGGQTGKLLGRAIGKAVAGHTLEVAVKEGEIVKEAILLVGKQTIQDKLSNPDQKTVDITEAINTAPKNQAGLSTNIQIQNPTYFDKAVKVASFAGTVGLGMALATGMIPMMPVSLTLTSLTSLPKIVGALTSTVDQSKESVGLVDDVLKPIAIQTAIKSAGVFAEGITRYEFVQTAYQSRLQLCEEIGQSCSSYMPYGLQNITQYMGKLAGFIEAPRYAMSEQVVNQAVQTGSLAKDITEAGLDTAYLVSQIALSPTTDRTYWDTARDTGIIAAGILGGAAFTSIAPEAAAIAGGTALISVADKAIKWMKIQLTSDPTKVEDKKIDSPAGGHFVQESPLSAGLDDIVMFDFSADI